MTPEAVIWLYFVCGTAIVFIGVHLIFNDND